MRPCYVSLGDGGAGSDDEAGDFDEDAPLGSHDREG